MGLRRASYADLIWVRRDGKTYIVRDTTTVQRAKAVWAPLEALSKQVQTQLEPLHKRGATQEELGELQRALGNLQGKLGELQGEAGGQQGAIGGKQGELGAQQEKLREQQETPIEQWVRLAKNVSPKMKVLLDNALAKGLAQPE